MPTNERYFRLPEHIGIEPTHKQGPEGPVENPKAGELQPFKEFRTVVAIPSIEDGEIVNVTEKLVVTVGPPEDAEQLLQEGATVVQVEPVGDERTFAIRDAKVAAILEASGTFEEVDQPRAAQPHVARPAPSASTQPSPPAPPAPQAPGQTPAQPE